MTQQQQNQDRQQYNKQQSKDLIKHDLPSTKDTMDLTMVIDRSGSMGAIAREANEGLKDFLTTQKEKVPNTILTLVQFDDLYEFVCKAQKITEFHGDYVLQPRGTTALLDAVGKASAEALERFDSLDSKKKVFVILTDGQENASQEWTLEKVKQQIEKLEKAGCEVVFLGADVNTYEDARAMGLSIGQTARYSRHNIRKGFHHASSNTVAYAASAAPDMNWMQAQKDDMDDDRQQAKKQQTKKQDVGGKLDFTKLHKANK